MRKKSHWRLADYLIRDNERPVIAFMFKVGSVAPDFMLRSMVKGHTYDATSHRVEQRLEKLEECGRWNMLSAYRMGYVTHYLADYFTAPHNKVWQYNLKEHCVFEKKQQDELRGYLESLWENPKQYYEMTDAMEYLRVLHERYEQKKPGVENDCAYIVNITEQLTYPMFALFNERQNVRYRLLRRRATM